MGLVNKAIENSKKLARASVKMIPKPKVGKVVKEPDEEMEEELEVEESGEEEVEEEMEEGPETKEEEIEEEVEEETPKKEIKYVIGEIVPYAKEVGYRVTDTDGTPIECKDYAQAILVSQAVKNEKTTTAS